MKSHDELAQWYQDFVTSTSDSRELAERDRDYVDNKQWTAEEQAILRKRKEPIVTINRIKPKIDSLIGLEVQSRVDVKAFPRTPKDEQSAEAATDSLRYIADNSDFDQVKTDAAYNLFIEGTCGGVVEVEKTSRGFEVRPHHIPWDRLIIDPRSCRKDGKDARWMGMAIWMDTEEARRVFPKAEDGAFNSDRHTMGDTHDDKPKDLFISDSRTKLIEIYYREAGQWHHCIFTGMGFLVKPRLSPYLDDESRPCNPIEIQRAFLDRDNNPYGYVRQMISVQDEINKRRSKALHLVSMRQVIAEDGAVNNVNTAKREFAKADGWIVKNRGFDIDVQNTSDLAMGQFNLLQEGKDEIDSIGANASVMGKDDRVQSGRALQSRQQAGMAELTPVLDGLRSWELRMYRQMWCRVKQFWTEEKWVRVTDDEKNVKFVGLNKPVLYRDVLEQRGTPYDALDPRLDEVVGIENAVAELDVDIILDAVPDTVNIQSEQFELLVQMYQANPEAIPMEMIVESSSLRNKAAIIERLQGGSEEEKAAKQQAAQEAVQIEMQGKVVDIKATDAKAARDAAEAEKTQVEAMRMMVEPIGI